MACILTKNDMQVGKDFESGNGTCAHPNPKFEHLKIFEFSSAWLETYVKGSPYGTYVKGSPYGKYQAFLSEMDLYENT